MDRDGLMRSLFEGVNDAKDPHNLTDLEKKHIPTIQRLRRSERESPSARPSGSGPPCPIPTSEATSSSSSSSTPMISFWPG